jgi:hypothetical protein
MSDVFRDPEFFRTRDHYEILQDGVRLLKADRSPCPVCGHPTGDCAPEKSENHRIAFADASTKVESLKESQKILVEEDVFEDRQITPFTKITVRIAKKGSYVTIDRAKEIGILKD